MFHNRTAELKALEDHYEMTEKRSRLLVIYGRRRVGKTTLVREFLRGKDGVYIFIEPRSEELILRECEELTGKRLGYTPRLDSWESLFDLARKERWILVFDEFQNLGKVDPYIFSQLQNIWDSIEDRPGLLFIAIGSYVGMIKKIFRNGKEPLFGRASGMMKLLPFDIYGTTDLLRSEGMDFEKSILAYSTLGGVPRYLIEFLLRGGNFRQLFFESTSLLAEEGRNILSLEFGTQHKGYFSVLESIAAGKNTPTEIGDHAGMKVPTVSKYLGELAGEYEIISKERPVTVSNRKFVRYRIEDNFLDFWFKHIHSNASLLTIDPGSVASEIESLLPRFVSRKMEGVAREVIIREKIISPTEIGRWWSRTGEEIDILAVDDKNDLVLFGEVKWRNRPTGWKTVLELKGRSKLVQWRKNDRNEKYLVVSKSGFTESCIECMDSEGIIHWDEKDLERLISG